MQKIIQINFLVNINRHIISGFVNILPPFMDKHARYVYVMVIFRYLVTIYVGGFMVVRAIVMLS